MGNIQNEIISVQRYYGNTMYRFETSAPVINMNKTIHYIINFIEFPCLVEQTGNVKRSVLTILSKEKIKLNILFEC